MKRPDTMRAMVTMGHGDLDQLVLHTDRPRPEPATDATTGGAFEEVGTDDPTWGGAPITFPRIQGADVCGEIVAVATGADPSRLGERVITEGWLCDESDLRDPGQDRTFRVRA